MIDANDKIVYDCVKLLPVYQVIELEDVGNFTYTVQDQSNKDKSSYKVHAWF